MVTGIVKPCVVLLDPSALPEPLEPVEPLEPDPPPNPPPNPLPPIPPNWYPDEAAVFTPTIWPWLLTSGPPESPGWMSALVWISPVRCSDA